MICAECDKEVFDRRDYLCRLCRIKAYEGLCEQCFDEPIDRTSEGFAGFCYKCKQAAKYPIPIFDPEPTKTVDMMVREYRDKLLMYDDSWDNP